MPHSIIPPYLLERLASATGLDAIGLDATAPDTDPSGLTGATRSGETEFAVARAAAARTLRHDEAMRTMRTRRTRRPGTAGASGAGPTRAIYDGHSAADLPGTPVRAEGQATASDPAVNEAYDGLGATYTFYAEVCGRDSIDGQGLPLNATVHYGRHYDNAFWNSEQMVFGDGDGQVFGRFTSSVSVIGHELTHGVTQYSGGLDYQGQAGALNESISDVFGALVEQYLRKQTADQASWLIGAGLFLPSVRGTAIRSMKAPGTAYDDPRLGKDPQPATMSGYVRTDRDNGGVHVNSGIPNHAFYLVAAALGGAAWERAGRIWYHTLTDGNLSSGVDFAGFAKATIDTATALYGAGSPETTAVRTGWRAVQVVSVGAEV
jgi:Zn-dependent metalloprotease